VGVTPSVVVPGETGYLARSTSEWTNYLRVLLTDSGLATEMGSRALAHVRRHYSDDVAMRSWRDLISSL
jgi:hypothetical protein